MENFTAKDFYQVMGYLKHLNLKVKNLFWKEVFGKMEN